MRRMSSVLAALVLSAVSVAAVDVAPTVTHITVSPGAASGAVGDTLYFTATAYYDIGGSSDVTDAAGWYVKDDGGSTAKAAGVTDVSRNGYFIDNGVYVPMVSGEHVIWAEYAGYYEYSSAKTAVHADAGVFTDSAHIDVYAVDTDVIAVDSTDTLIECDNADLDIALQALYGSGTVTVSMFTGTYPPGLPGGNPIQKYYSIDASGNIDSFTVTLIFYYTDEELLASDITDETSLYCAYYDSVSGTWIPMESTVDTAANTVTCVTTHFSIWAIGGDGGSLPVSLTGFSAVAGATGVELAWSTSCEQDNLGWNVYRVLDGTATKVNTSLVPGAGTSGETHSYTFSDAAGTPECTYRLEQVDEGGAGTIVAETGVGAVSGIVTGLNGDACLVALNGAQRLTLTVTGLDGRNVFSTGARYGSGTVRLAMPAVPADGIYIVTVRGASFSAVRKVFLAK